MYIYISKVEANYQRNDCKECEKMSRETREQNEQFIRVARILPCVLHFKLTQYNVAVYLW